MASAFHYLPLHPLDMKRRFGGQPGDCHEIEERCDRLARLPFYNSITEADSKRVFGLVRQLRVAG